MDRSQGCWVSGLDGCVGRMVEEGRLEPEGGLICSQEEVDGVCLGAGGYRDFACGHK